MRLQVSFTLPREAVSVPLVRHLIGATLERAGVTEACVDDVKVAVSEQATPVADTHEESGRGIDLIRALTEAARFDTVTDAGGAVHMWKRLDWEQGAPWASGPPSGDKPPVDCSD